MWLIHIDTWSYPDPQKIIDLIPPDIRPYIVMNISISINHDNTTGKWLQAEYGYETAKSWVRTCAENRMWVMIQQSSGGFAHFSDFDLSVYEEFYRDYPNFIGFNYAEQFWGFGDQWSVTWTERIAHFTNLLGLSQKYGGYLITSWCGAYYGAGINPIATLKKNPDFAAACQQAPQHFILCEKFTSKYGFSDIESTCLGTYLSGYSGHYGIRFDDTGWTGLDGLSDGDPDDKFPVASGIAPIMEHALLTGQTVMDGPELIWAESIEGLPNGTTSDGYTTRRWQFHIQLENISMDIFRKILDGTLRIPTRKEVIDRSKVVIINDVSSGSDLDKYSSPTTLFEGLYRMDVDGNMLDNRYWFKKTGRYPAIPTVYQLSGTDANSFPVKINKSTYSTRWPDIATKVSEFNNLFPEEYTGDIYAGRHENTWVTYNPYKANQTATGTIPFKYNTCNGMVLDLQQYSGALIKETANKVTFYLNNFNGTAAGLRTNVIRIYGASSEPTYSFVDRGDHEASVVTKTWLGGIFTLNVAHNGPLDITVNCSGTATGRLTSYTTSAMVPPASAPVYTGPHQYEAENFDYKNIGGNVTQGVNSGVANYTAQGYLKFGTNVAASIRDTVTVPNAGTYRLETKYSTEANVNTIDLYVNGTKVATPAFNQTTSLSTWAIHVRNVNLNAGANTIEFRANAAAASSVHFDNVIIAPTLLPSGTYRISSRYNGKVLDAYNYGTANGTQIIQWTYGGGSNQRWNVTNLGNNQYSIIGVQSGKSIDINNGSSTNGTKVHLWDYWGGNMQKYVLTPMTGAGTGYYRISPVHAPESCLDISGISSANGALIQLWTWAGGHHQQWSFQGP
jgi:hypothetical protein